MTGSQVSKMSSDRANHPSEHFLIAHFSEVLTVLVVLVVLQLGLAPYDFFSLGGVQRRVEFFSTARSQVTLPDAIGNIALYVPLGILLHTVLRRRFGRRILGAFATVLGGAALSAGVEWLQAYSPARVSSLIDLVANVLGTAVGVAIASAFGSLVPGLLGALLYDLRHRPATAALKAYCGLLVIFATMPFTFSFDTQRLAEAYKASSFVPFATPPAEQAVAERAVAERAMSGAASGAVAGRGAELARWMGMKRWARWAAEAVSFVVLALLMQSLFRHDYGFSRRAATGLVWWLCGLWALLLSALQLPVAMRVIDVTDVVFRLVGVGGGLLLSSSMRSPRDERGVAWVFTPRLVRVGCVVTVSYVVYTGVVPLTFDFDGGALRSAISSAAFMPFTAYSFARPDAVLSDLTDKVAVYAVLAGLLAARRMGASSRAIGAGCWRVLAVCVGLSSVIEFVQVFIPIRVPSLTDPILAAVGCVLGVGVQRTAMSLFRHAGAHEMVGPLELIATPGGPSLGLTDRLIATLTEPDPQAPVEVSPTHGPRVR
jgi:VanZ family protein